MEEKLKSKNKKIDPKVLKISLIMLLGMIAPALNATIVNVAIMTITIQFQSDIATVQWITTAYILVMGIAVPISAWLVNRFSGKAVYLFALSAFTLGSILAIFSWNIESLIAFRVIQGMGAGILLPVMQTVIIRYAGGRKLPSLMAIISIPAAIIPILGPTIGGLIVNYLPWQWIFIINIPICVIALLLGVTKLPPGKATDITQPLDIIGLLLLTPAFCALIFGISALRDSVTQKAFIELVAGAALMAAYCVYCLRSKKEPPLNIRLFKHKNFASSVALVFFFGVISTGPLFILPLWFQQVYNETSFTAGLLLAPQGIGMLLTRGFSGKITEKIGAKITIILGVMFTLLGTVPLSLLSNVSGLYPIIAVLLIRGMGLGILMVPVMMTAYDELGMRDIPHGTTATRIAQQIGGAAGTAALVIILTRCFNSMSNAQAFNIVFWLSSILTAILVIPALLLSATAGREK